MATLNKEEFAISDYLHSLDITKPLAFYMARGLSIKLAEVVKSAQKTDKDILEKNMTKDEILNMPAGREMDYVIMWYFDTSITKEKFALNGYDFSTWMKCTKRIPNNYSTDIAVAWKFLERFYLTDFSVEKVDDHYCVNLIVASACAETAPLAICRAALLAVMEEK